MVESDGGDREEWWRVMDGGREGWGMMEGGGMGNDGGRAAGPSSSVGARHPWALVVCGWGGRCQPCALAGRPRGVVLPVGVCHAWVARREGRRRLWGTLLVRACVGVVVRRWGLFCPWALSVVGAGWWFCSWVAVVVCGCWASFVGAGSLSVGAGSLFLGAELSIVGAGARPRERVLRGCWFVVCGRGCAVW